MVQDQLVLMRLRNTSPAFHGALEIAETAEHVLDLTWQHDGHSATLRANLSDHSFTVMHTDRAGTEQELSYSR